MDRLRISENGRYFIHEDGTPFPWLADTAWTMPQRMKWDDVEYYMEKRKSQGFTVLQIVALDPERDEQMRSPAGEKALHNDCLDTPNERYFEYLDWILDKAEAYGFYVLLLPAWGQLVVGENWSGDVFEKCVTEDNAWNYGKWIGERYKDRKNILWCLGGDRQPIHKGTDYRMVWRRMAEGLVQGITGKQVSSSQADDAWKEVLMTYHSCYEQETGECSTLSYWDEEEPWIQFVMIQSGHGLTVKNYEIIQKEYQRDHVRPVWDGEPAYEMMPTSWPVADSFHDAWMVRRRAYWSLFAGAFGFTYGHASVWCTISEKELDQIAVYTWFESLEGEGAYQMKYLRTVLEDLQTMRFIPAQEMLVQADTDKDVKRGCKGDKDACEATGDAIEQELSHHIQICEDPDGTYICAYLPSGGALELDLAKAPVPVKNRESGLFMWWFNPRDGRYYDKDGSQTEQEEKVLLDSEADGEKLTLRIEAPTQGRGEDWILILCSESKMPIRIREFYHHETQSKLTKVFEW